MYYNIYFFLIYQFLFSWLVFIKNKKNSKKILFYIFLFIYTFYMGNRPYSIGADTQNYIDNFESGTGGYFSEYGFKLLGILLYRFNFTAQEYLMTIAFLETLVILVSYSKLYKNKNKFYVVIWICLFNVTYLFGYINITRQFIASLFLLLSCTYIRKNKIKKYFWYFVSFLFHMTTIFCIFIFIEYFFKKYEKLSSKYKILLLLLTMIISQFIYPMFLFYKKFVVYLTIESNQSMYVKIIGATLFYIIYLKYNIQKNKIFEYVFFVLLLLILLFLKFPLLSGRLIYYLNIFTPILLMNLCDRGKIIKRIILCLILLYHTLLLFYPSVQWMLFNNN